MALMKQMRFSVISTLPIIILGWFVFKTAWLAVNVPPGFPPDEMFHIQLIEHYAKSDKLFFFNNASNTIERPLAKHARYGPYSELPYLYHLTIGKVAKLLGLNPYEFDTIVLIRVLSLLMVTLGLVACLRLFQLFGLSPLERSMALVIVSSLLMFSAQAAAVSYDSIFFLSTSVAFLLFVKLLGKFELSGFILLLSIIGFGCLIKVSMLAFAACILLPLLPALLKRDYTTTVSIARILLLMVLTLANLELYVGNLYQYGKLAPECQDIFSAEVCQQGYDSQELGIASAKSEEARIGFFAFIPQWFYLTVDRTLGIYSHHGVQQGAAIVIGYGTLILLALCSYIYCQFRQNIFCSICLLTSFAYCTLFILLYIYPHYLITGEAGYCINGRYVFNILPCLAAAMTIAVRSITYLPLRRFLSIALAGSLIVMEAAIIFISPDFKQGYLTPPQPSFYQSLAYNPGPVYDQALKLIIDPKILN